jgi:FKBP-type peptidyl-prolyl cis-trans isomerase 2
MPAKIKVVTESIEEGITAKKGNCVTYSARFFLNRGDEITNDFKSIELYGDRIPTRNIEDVELIEHTTTLGKRQSITGDEVALTGLSPGSFREVIIPPHVAYGSTRTDTIPPNSLLRAKIWLHEIRNDA